jgi:hypothetical protein
MNSGVMRRGPTAKSPRTPFSPFVRPGHGALADAAITAFRATLAAASNEPLVLLAIPIAIPSEAAGLAR